MKMGRDRRQRPRLRRLPLAGSVALLALAVLAGVWMALEPLERRFFDADQAMVGGKGEIVLAPGTSAGQTFVAHHSGFAGVELWLEPSSTAQLTATLHLRRDPQDAQDLAHAEVAIRSGAPPGFYRFAFAPRQDSLGEYYYAWIELQGAQATLPLASGGSYLDGSAYQDGEPLDAQAGFRLVYAPVPVIAGLIRSVPGALGLLGIGGLLLVLPGWALLALLGPRRELVWAERLALAAGISLALMPLLMLWTDLIGIRLGALNAWLPAGIGAALLVWQGRKWRPRPAGEAVRRWAGSQAAWPDVALLALLGLVVCTRWVTVRTLDVPLWGDSYQHTMIVQLLVDHRGLFDSWQPYSAIDRFTYHFGFHSAAAAVHWVSGLSASQAVLWTGQMLNVLAVLTLYPLALRISGSRWAGVACTLLAGLLSPMPMAYVNWGRYTQLAGQVVLPVAIWLTWELVESADRQWRMEALLAVVVAGLALSHYRVLAFYALFVVVFLPFRLSKASWRETLLRLAIAVLGGSVLFLPWLIHTFQGAAILVLGHQLTTLPNEVSTFTRENNTVTDLRRYLAPAWWMALPLALGWAIWRKQRAPLVVAAWSGLTVLAANPAWLGLPGTGTISNFAVVIAVYVPAGLLVGFLAAQVIGQLPQRGALVALLALLAAGAGVWGARERLKDVDVGGHAYVTRPDVRAASWIRENTTPDALFLVNSTPAYGGTTIVGADGGWWLPLLSGRKNTVPPLSYANELRRGSELREQMETVARLVEMRGATDPQVVGALRTAGVTHVYVGQRQGEVNDTTPATLDPASLLTSDAFEAVYHQDRVWVFRLSQAE